MTELRGKIVLLDFWTFCCINCHHILPDLAKLEEKYKNELVVIGVHTAKFDAERDTENIRRKVREYRIKHPVINDANMTIWKRFGVDCWPTLVLIDANGKFVGAMAPAKDTTAAVDRVDRRARRAAQGQGRAQPDPAQVHRRDGTAVERPAPVSRARCSPIETGKRLFIADTGHNRIIQTNLDGTGAVVIGSGEEGFDDGDFKKATFNRPRACAWTARHSLCRRHREPCDPPRRLARLATSRRSPASAARRRGFTRWARPGPPGRPQLCSPWDVIQLPGDKALYIAMAGPHQIWKLDLAARTIDVFAGSGRENIVDGPAASANFAQPSGLATDGENLFVADSEVSGVRVITGIHETKGQGPVVRTIVGEGLFDSATSTAAGQTSAFSIAWASPMRTGTSTSRTRTTTRSRSATPGPERSERLVGTASPATATIRPTSTNRGA